MGFPNFVAIASASRQMQSLLLGALALLTKAVPDYLRQHFVDKVDCGIYFFVLAALYGRYQFGQCGPGISPEHLTSQWRVETSCRSRHFAIYPTLMYKLFSSFSYLLVRLMLCGGVLGTEIKCFENFKSYFDTSYHFLVGSDMLATCAYHAGQNDCRYRSEIKSKTIGPVSDYRRYRFILNRKQ